MHVALLRGINVGGNRMLPMADLAPMFEAAGASEVRTYIQSGNVVFAAPAAVAGRVARGVMERIGKKFGFEPVIVVRTAEEMAAVASAHPFWKKGVEEKLLHVGFLDGEPDAEAIARLDPERSPKDRFEVRGREMYVHYGAGAGQTKLTSAYIDSRLGVTSTFRNWNTVVTLAEMAGGDAAAPAAPKKGRRTSA